MPVLSLREAIRPATLVESLRLSERLGARVVLVTETFQHTGSFKFRAAYHVVRSVPHPAILTASSGNFGQAMALACRMAGKRCTVVMPENSSRVKIEAVRSYGAVADLIDTSRIGRAERVEQIARQQPDAYVASAYDDPYVIEGNATLGEELAAHAAIRGPDLSAGQVEKNAQQKTLSTPFDIVVAPVGGGGLTSGIVTGLRRAGRQDMRVFGAEPLLGNDAARSLRSGRIERNDLEPQTIADGARTVSLGERNWAILKEALTGIVEVPEEAIAEAVRLLFREARLLCEPTGALAVGALLASPNSFRDERVCCVISGGNVDPVVYARLLGGAS